MEELNLEFHLGRVKLELLIRHSSEDVEYKPGSEGNRLTRKGQKKQARVDISLDGMSV